MRRHRIAVGSNLKGKLSEIGFFLNHIMRVSEIIERKHHTKDYPINIEHDELNYFFSAYLNSIQALKDACQTAMGIDITWEELSPTYGKFIYYCRNATTHDGSLMINAGQGVLNYIVGPLRRIDSKRIVKEFSPPREDVVTLSRNIASEILQTTKAYLEEQGSEIPLPDYADFGEMLDTAKNSDFIPDFVKKIMSEKHDEVFRLVSNSKFDYAKDALDVIKNLQLKLGLDTTSL